MRQSGILPSPTSTPVSRTPPSFSCSDVPNSTILYPTGTCLSPTPSRSCTNACLPSPAATQPSQSAGLRGLASPPGPSVPPRYLPLMGSVPQMMSRLLLSPRISKPRFQSQLADNQGLHFTRETEATFIGQLYTLCPPNCQALEPAPPSWFLLSGCYDGRGLTELTPAPGPGPPSATLLPAPRITNPLFLVVI